ncbi:MAG: ribonuclease E/G [Elusimicrobia bacterium]|nr:ribonuclease E/G [Elusimicrobiota bacterium]
MKREIIANVLPEETRIAVLDNGRLAEFMIERPALGMAKLVGNIYKGRVENVLPGISSAFVNTGFEKNAYLYVTDVVSNAKERHIEKMIKRNEDIMVQVAKEAISTKGMKVTMDISLPGRYLIYMPKSDHLGVSKNIEEPEERERLRRIIDEENMAGGIIVRTEAEGADEGELRAELKYLAKLWEGIQRKYESAQSGTLIHRELGLTFQVARDLLTSDAQIFLVDDRQEYKEVKDFVTGLAPSWPTGCSITRARRRSSRPSASIANWRTSANSASTCPPAATSSSRRRSPSAPSTSTRGNSSATNPRKKPSRPRTWRRPRRSPSSCGCGTSAASSSSTSSTCGASATRSRSSKCWKRPRSTTVPKSRSCPSRGWGWWK